MIDASTPLRGVPCRAPRGARIGLLLALTAAAPAVAGAQQATLLKDINTVVDPSPGIQPYLVRAGDDRVYFYALGSAPGVDLWLTEGTPATTRPVTDLLAWTAQEMATLGNLAVFVSGGEPWVTDGTPSGTHLIRRIGPLYDGSNPTQLTSAAGLVFMNASEGGNPSLWRTDGTEAGTFKVSLQSGALLYPGPGPLFFTKHDPQAGYELWTSDGSMAGTHIVMDVCPGTCGAVPSLVTRLGGAVYFTADDGTHGPELWRSDVATGATSMVADLVPGSGSPGIHAMAAAGPMLFFATSDGALWRSDGSAAGTQVVTSVDARHLTAVGDRLFFVGAQPATGRELWRSDGTAAGTVPVTDACPGACHTFPDPSSSAAFSLKLVGTSQVLFFTRPDAPPADIPLWRSDGTAAGTFALAQRTNPNYSAVLDEQFVFVSEEGATGWELWRSDGSVPGTIPLTAQVENSSHPSDPVVAGDRLFFQAFRPDLGREPWVTEGTDATTTPIDLTPGTASTEVEKGGALGRDLLFQLVRGPLAIDTELWTSDGTVAGSTLLKELYLTVPPVQLGPIALMSAGEFGDATLWRTDGTAEGTTLVKDPGEPPYGAHVIFLAAQAGTQYFSNFGAPSALWRTDGTTEGTLPISSIYARDAAPLGTSMVLSADDGSTGAEPWITDGWPQGTRSIVDLLPGPLQASSPRSMTTLGDEVFFTASTLEHGEELWKTDGTAQGTVIVREILPGWPGSIPAATEGGLAAMNGALYFIAYDLDFRLQLWRTHGTPETTVVVRPAGAPPEWTILLPFLEPALTVAGGRLWFVAHTQAEGRELWQSDGTDAGTVLVTDVAPGPASSVPEDLRSDARRLYFFADDGVHGKEPWVIDLPATLSVADARADEGDGGTRSVSFEIRVSRPVAADVVVAYQTENGTAVQGQDYHPATGLLTFTAGATVGQVSVPVVADLRDEPEEHFRLRLHSPVQATLADGEAVAVIVDDDAPRVDLHDIAVTEGDAGATPAVLQAELTTKDGLPAPLVKSVAFNTIPFTARAGTDFAATSGTVTFPAGSASGSAQPVGVPVLGDTLDEADERFLVHLTPASDVLVTTPEAGTLIVDDDGGDSGRPVELQPGTRLRRALAQAPDHWYVMSQRPLSSYEIVIDEVSGDAQPLSLERLTAGGTYVIQTGEPVGTGGAVSLRWQDNPFSPALNDQEFRVRSGSCRSDCGQDDVYQLRVYDTTLSGARVVTEGSQQTFLIAQNRTRSLVSFRTHYWTESGTVSSSSVQTYLAPGQSLVQATPTGVSRGSVTVSHDAGYGGLAAKLVTLDTAAGFSFDTALTYRPR